MPKKLLFHRNTGGYKRREVAMVKNERAEGFLASGAAVEIDKKGHPVTAAEEVVEEPVAEETPEPEEVVEKEPVEEPATED